MRWGAESECQGLPVATDDTAGVKVCRWQPLTQLCPLDELFTPHWSPLDELFTPHWSCWKRLYRFAENNLTMRLLTRRKLLMELLMRLLTATAQG
jgi:hypothetical protein